MVLGPYSLRSALPKHFVPSIRATQSHPQRVSTSPNQSSTSKKSKRMSTITYPETRRQDFVEDLHGVNVADPYRWLEDPKSEETKAFVEAQNKIFEDYLAQFPYTAAYRESLTTNYDYERYGTAFRCGNRWYYMHNSGLQAQSVYYTLEEDQIDTKEKGTVFFDPNTLSEDGTISLASYQFSQDGSLFTYALSTSGSDWNSARFRDLSTGKEYPETLEWLKYTSLSSTRDNKGVFYQRFPEPAGVNDAGTETTVNGAPQLYYHVCGTEQSEDILIFEDPEHPHHMFGGRVTLDGDWIRFTVSDSTDPTNKLSLAKLENKSLPADGKLNWIKIKDDFNSGLNYISNHGSVFYFESNLNAPRGKIVRYDVNQPELGFETIVPEQSHAVLEDARLAHGKYLILIYLHNVQNKVLVVPLDSLVPKSNALANGVGNTYRNGDVNPIGDSVWIGLDEAEELDLPVGCSIDSLWAREDEQRVFFRCMGYTLAGRIYQYTLRSAAPYQNGPYQNGSYQNGYIHPVSKSVPRKPYGELSIWRQSHVNGFDSERWTVEQVWVPNPNDGVQIPMYMIHDKSLVKSGDSFCLLYGYGGFGISLTPGFLPNMAAMLTHSGGIYCVANIRGGGEFGEEWHKAAVREKRPVAFADFEECGRYLIREGWTKKEKLVCQGGSNGGALIAAVMNRAGEEIFAAGVAQVGVLDLLRYHLFTVGYAWKQDFGDPDVKEDFEFIRKWSPYHNIRDGNTYQYPAILCETSDHDDRVVPLHSFKYIAALQHSTGRTNKAPLLLRHHVKAGHGAGKPTKKVIEEASERFAFMMLATGTEFKTASKHKL